MTSIEGCSLVPASMEVACSEVDLGLLVRTYTPLLFRVAHSVLRNRAEAEDTVQDVFVRVLEHRWSLSSVQDMRPWLIRIAWNLALDRRRRIRPEQLDQEFIGTLVAKNVPADQALHESQRIQAVLHELERLPKGERHVLLLTTVDELGAAEIGELLGRSESAVRSLLFRARARLRDRLEREEGKR
jgi:RNA polymerase sigma-70 factor (ECF subfamily)